MDNLVKKLKNELVWKFNYKLSCPVCLLVNKDGYGTILDYEVGSCISNVYVKKGPLKKIGSLEEILFTLDKIGLESF